MNDHEQNEAETSSVATANKLVCACVRACVRASVVFVCLFVTVLDGNRKNEVQRTVKAER